jgi:hypothetical protein
MRSCSTSEFGSPWILVNLIFTFCGVTDSFSLYETTDLHKSITTAYSSRKGAPHDIRAGQATEKCPENKFDSDYERIDREEAQEGNSEPNSDNSNSLGKDWSESQSEHRPINYASTQAEPVYSAAIKNCGTLMKGNKSVEVVQGTSSMGISNSISGEQHTAGPCLDMGQHSLQWKPEHEAWTVPPEEQLAANPDLPQYGTWSISFQDRVLKVRIHNCKDCRSKKAAFAVWMRCQNRNMSLAKFVKP